MILMMLGPVPFTVAPLNLQDYESSRKVPFAFHEVLGAEPIAEDVGFDNVEFKIKAVLHPEHFGGLPMLDGITKIRDSKAIVPLMRGDGKPLGWYVVTGTSIAHSEIGFVGVGREVMIDIELRSQRPPSAGGGGGVPGAGGLGFSLGGSISFGGLSLSAELTLSLF